MDKFLQWLQSLNIPNPPHSVEDLMQRKELDLSYKGLSYLPDEICNLTNLKGLNLIRNELRFLPRDFGKLTNLVKLGLCSNKYLADISEISNLTNLQWLNLSGNKGIEIPDLSKLQNLKELYIQDMNIFDSSIDRILQAKNVERLNIAQNDFRDIEALGGLKKLEYIVFDADSWYLRMPKWLENDEWSYTTDTVQYYHSVYVFRKNNKGGVR